MSKDQGARKYLDIPGEKTLVYTFKFNLDLPPPVPPPKTMYIPLDPERYIKPKLTLFHVKKKANLLADINLSIPVDEVNMRPELYNPAPDAKFELTEKDRELLEERVQVKKEASTKPQTTNGKSQNKDIAVKTEPATGKPKQADTQSKKPEASQQPKKKEEQKKLSVDEYVKKTFEIASTYTVGANHPSKEGLQCEEVFEIVPDFSNIIAELYALKTEVSADTLKTKENLIKFETDLDKKPILSIFVNTPLDEQEIQKKKEEGNMEEEDQTKVKEEAKPRATEIDQDPLLKRVENFEHIGNYVYSQPKPHGTIKRDLLLNLNKKSGKALIYQPHSLILKKKKVLFMNKTVKKEEDSDDERKPKESKKTIKILKRDADKDELLLKKRKFQELHLENTSLYKRNSQELENYKEPEEDELGILKKRFVVEEEAEEEERGEEDEEEEEPRKVKEEDEEEAEAEFDEKKEENEEAEEERVASQQEVKEEKSEQMEEEAQYKEEAKPAKAKSEDEDAQELADFFADSDEDD